MSKLLEIYKSKKLQNNMKIYMFKGGVFYYFLDDDARYISSKYNFKLTKFGDSVKCGFPVKSLEKYLSLFSLESIELVIEENTNLNEHIIRLIKDLDMNNISPKDAYVFLCDLKEKIDE